MKIERTSSVASEVLRDLEHTFNATFSLKEVELVDIDGEQFFSKQLDCYSLEITLNGRDVLINTYGHTFKPFSDLRRIQVEDLLVFYNPRKVLLYDNLRKELLGEVTRVADSFTYENVVSEDVNMREV